MSNDFSVPRAKGDTPWPSSVARSISSLDPPGCRRKRSSPSEKAPNGIDVYFDNVGGDHLNAALPRMNLLGRIPVCGMISAYNTAGSISSPVTTLSNIIYKRVTLRGFVATDFMDLREQFVSDMSGWLKDGRVKYQETIYDGIENAPKALIGMLNGANTGKMLVRLSR